MGGLVAFSVGCTSLSVFGPALKQMKSLDTVSKTLLSACPTLTGSLPRIPYGFSFVEKGGKSWTKNFLILSCLGTLVCVISVFAIDISTMKPWSP